jgi:hypothetical protein
MERYSHGKQAIDFVAMKKRLEAGIKVNPDDEKENEKAIVGGD